MNAPPPSNPLKAAPPTDPAPAPSGWPGGRSVPAALPASLLAKGRFRAHALYVGERIELRSMSAEGRLATHPLTLALEAGGVAVVFRYGSVVLFDVSPETESEFLESLRPQVDQWYERPEAEAIWVELRPGAREMVEGSTMLLQELSVQRLQVAAEALGKTVALAQYESDVAGSFDRIHPIAAQLERGGRGRRRMKELLRHIGRGLLTEHKLVARVELAERPELLWEHPELEPLYLRLEEEFELRERGEMLDHKLKLVNQTVSTVMGLLQYARTLQVEWYIVALIVIEVVLSVYDMFWRG